MSAATTEEAFFIEVGAHRLFALLHRPTHNQPSLAVVMCHALAEEKLWSHRVYVKFARQLANAGAAVLRFDMRGEGDSDLEFEDSTLETRIEDTMSAVAALRARVGADCRIVLLGHRFGGSIAAAAASRLGDQVQGLAIWDPLPDSADYFQQLLRSNLTTQMAIHGKVIRTRDALIEDLMGGAIVVADGYGLHRNFYQQAIALDWPRDPAVFSRPVLLLEVAKAGQTEPSSRFAELVQAYPQTRAHVVVEPPLWRETRQFHQDAKQFGSNTREWLAATWQGALA
jgi:pimeloyl-ACP methyl ester carboxylesterase